MATYLYNSDISSDTFGTWRRNWVANAGPARSLLGPNWMRMTLKELRLNDRVCLRLSRYLLKKAIKGNIYTRVRGTSRRGLLLQSEELRPGPVVALGLLGGGKVVDHVDETVSRVVKG